MDMSHSQNSLLYKDKKNLQKILIISILIISISISFMIRILPADYGFELNEFDPFFNYRATQFIVENGLSEYFDWHDELSWYPYGRDISANSQNILHIFTAITYSIFGNGVDLYDYVIIFPAIIGSLTTLTVFALGRIVGGTSVGLFSSLLFSISIPFLVRGQIGWFKSEPLGMFLSTLSIYLFLSGIYTTNKKLVFTKMFLGGIILTSSISAWGGNQYFVMILGIFIFSLALIKKPKFSIWSVPTFVIGCLSSALVFERLSYDFIFGLSGIALVIPTVFFVISSYLEKIFSYERSRKMIFIVMSIILIITFTLVTINFIHLSIYNENLFFYTGSYRYLNALNPFLITSNPLIESISEHAVAQLPNSFIFHSVTMIFGSIGIWLLLSKTKEIINVKSSMIIFLLIMGFLGMYISSAFMRLEVFAALSLILLSSTALSILIKTILIKKLNFSYKLIFITLLITILVLPLTIIPGGSIFTISHNPPTILNGGTNYNISSNDWNETLEWIKNNIDEKSVIASWWDYGYWIQTKGERTSYVDNATLITHSIENIAKIFFSEPNEAWKSLNELNIQYILIFVAAEKTPITDDDGNSLYVLRGGGDESKLFWISQIGGQNTFDFLEPNGISPTPYFWKNTLIGKLIPYSSFGYLNPNNPSTGSLSFVNGYVEVYTKEVKYDSSNELPFNLVFSSSSYQNPINDQNVIGVFVYKLNSNYQP